MIDRRVRELNVYSEILPLNTTAKELKEKKFRSAFSKVTQSTYLAELFSIPD